MNERINDLVGQAKFMAEETINRKISSNLELNTFAEKFAELIVKECAACSYHMDRDSGPITADLIKIRIMSVVGG